MMWPSFLQKQQVPLISSSVLSGDALSFLAFDLSSFEVKVTFLLYLIP
uniref:Uncharacterized protein n=1 Tax=Arundo donax TaxID=35708 RepID=A0A0A8ZF72_ARUDO